MRKQAILTCASSLMLGLALVACGQPATTNSQEGSAQVNSASTSGSEASADAASSTATEQAATSAIGTVSNALAADEDALVSTYASRFSQETYDDSETGLSITYNLFLPEGYDASKSYPMVVFIADSSCAKGDPTQSLTQGLGALVWVSDEWQAAHPTIVCVPTYAETILDDHSGYATTDYVEATARLIDSVKTSYAVDASRIYGTGQSMGCMTTLTLASQHPDLYAGCMFVDGQWDVSTLQGLEGQRFVYFAAEDDERAFAGMGEVMAMFETDGKPFASAQWDGNWSFDELSQAATELFSQGKDANFVSWAAGTIDAGSTGGEGGGMAGGEGGGMAGGNGGGMGGASAHMASFDYAYRCIAAMEWLFQ